MTPSPTSRICSATYLSPYTSNCNSISIRTKNPAPIAMAQKKQPPKRSKHPPPSQNQLSNIHSMGIPNNKPLLPPGPPNPPPHPEQSIPRPNRTSSRKQGHKIPIHSPLHLHLPSRRPGNTQSARHHSPIGSLRDTGHHEEVRAGPALRRNMAQAYRLLSGRV